MRSANEHFTYPHSLLHYYCTNTNATYSKTKIGKKLLFIGFHEKSNKLPLLYSSANSKIYKIFFTITRSFVLKTKSGTYTYCTILTSRSFKKFQQNINLPSMGIELTTLTITGLEF